MIHFITGRSGSGKTTYIYEQIKNTACRNISEGTHRRVFLIVPEQYTFQAQRDLADVLQEAGGGMLFTEVQSFARLSYRVFKETGRLPGSCMGELGKVMLVRSLMEKNRESLAAFGRNAGKKGYVSEIKSVISEMMQYGQKPSDVEKMKESVSDDRSLAMRLSDIELIYSEFKKYISGSGILTSDEMMDIFADAVHESSLLREADIYFDGFTGFTPLQYKVIKALSQVCSDIYFSVAADSIVESKATSKLFEMSVRTISHIRREAEKSGIPVEEKHFDRVMRYGERKDLAFLEKNILRYSRGKIFAEVPENISISVLKDPYGEIDFCIEQIKNIMLKEKLEGNTLHFRDFAIVTGDIETYGTIAKYRMARRGIKVFVDTKADITDNMFIDAVESLMNIIRYDFEYSAVMGFLRNGIISSYLGDDMKESTDLLDNFLMASGIRGHKSFEKEWSGINRLLGTEPAGRRSSDNSKKSDRDPFNIASKVNNLRKILCEMTEDIYSSCAAGKHPVSHFCSALREFFTSKIPAEEILSARCDEFRSHGDRVRELEYSQIFTVFQEVLDEAEETLKDVRTDFKGFWDIFNAGLGESKIGIIPPSADSVSFGDITRSRAGNVKYLFFIGVNDSVIPKAAPKTGVISDDERERLKGSGFELAPSFREDLINEQFYLYLAMAKPSRRLFFTYSESGTDSRALRPSYLISRVKKLFPKLTVEFPDEQMLPEHVLGADGGRRYIIEKIRERSPYDRDMALGIFKGQELERLENASLFTKNPGKINKATAAELYGIDAGRLLSVSQVEKYAQCEFMYFLNYGLGLRVRREKKVQPADIGNIIHAALSAYAQGLDGRPWQNVSDDEKAVLKTAAFKEALESEPENVRQGKGVNRYIVRRTAKTFSQAVDLIEEQMKQGEYTTFATEMEYTMKLGRREFKGYIDRIDTADDGENVYVKVIDYKTGTHKLELSKLYYGIQMQLAVYMGAAEKKISEKCRDKKVIPAGIYYFNVDDYYIDAEGKNDSGKDPRPDGMTCDDPGVLKEIDRDLVSENSEGLPELNPGITSEAVKISTKKADRKTGEVSLSKTSETGTSAQMRNIINFIPVKIKDLENDRTSGKIQINPYRTGTGENPDTPCRFCPFRPVCGFDGHQESPGSFRYIDRLGNEKAMELITRRVNNEEAEKQ